MNKIFVIGSINIDITVSGKRLPEKGETVKADKFYIYPGGKGANQAISAGRCGAKTELIGKIGKDYFGDIVNSYLKRENIGLSLKYGKQTGMAFINVDNHGKNMITVYPGSNNELDYNDFNYIRIKNSIIMFQQEIPLKTIEDTIKNSLNNNIIITDPSPFIKNEFILKNSNFLTPNEKEAELLSEIRINSIEDAEKASKIIHEKYNNDIIIKLGSKGSLINYNSEIMYYKPYKVNAVDTTGAGDCFNGAFASRFLETNDVNKSMEFANTAAAISTLSYGAFPSFPYINDVLNAINKT